MGMCPEEMERWGAVSIFKESATLLHKHYRLFLPFFLAFYLSTSIEGAFGTLFLPAAFTLFPNAIVVKGDVNTAQTTDPPGGQSSPIIFSWILVQILDYIVGTLGTGAVFYITAYFYTPIDTDDDRSIVPKVFKLLPHAFLRIFITRLWISLAVILIGILSAIIFGIFFGIMSAAAGWSDLSLSFLIPFFLVLAGTIFLAILLALAPVIAVLEPGNYGRKGLKRSTNLVRIGRVWTIVAVGLTAISLLALLTVTTNRINMSGVMPLWAKVVLLVVIRGVDLVFRVYFGVVVVVMYFVYKARFSASGRAGIPSFKLIDSAEHSYNPIVEGKSSATYIGEP